MNFCLVIFAGPNYLAGFFSLESFHVSTCCTGWSVWKENENVSLGDGLGPSGHCRKEQSLGKSEQMALPLWWHRPPVKTFVSITGGCKIHSGSLQVIKWPPNDDSIHALHLHPCRYDRHGNTDQVLSLSIPWVLLTFAAWHSLSVKNHREKHAITTSPFQLGLCLLACFRKARKHNVSSVSSSQSASAAPWSQQRSCPHICSLLLPLGHRKDETFRLSTMQIIRKMWITLPLLF